MRAIIQSAYILRREVLRLLRLRTTGIKVMLFNDADELLLIRNAYGDSGQYLLPGGGVSRGESPAAAAIREVREEIGIELDRVEPVWTFESNAEGKRDTIHLFKAKTHGRPEIDGREVIEARFFPLGALPSRVSPATLRRIEEISGERPIDGRW
jgi:8-oxo-dGTP pyrophosphatase MutT (NUDIX family)